jgi:recombination protein RecR
MMKNIGPLEHLIESLGTLPGIGQKSASRLAFFLLKHPDEEVLALAEAIVNLKKHVRYCSTCHNVTTADPCGICSDLKRDRSVVCVVEQPQDLIAVENTAEYRGLYHVLQGALSPVSGIGPADLTTDALRDRILKSAGEIKEIIIATNPTNDGETTAVYLAEELKDLDVKISRIAQGLPVGSNLEYADNVTMARAILTRRTLT